MDFLHYVLLSEHTSNDLKRNIAQLSKTKLVETWEACINSAFPLSYSSKYYKSYSDIVTDFENCKLKCNYESIKPFYPIDKTINKKVETLLIQTTNIKMFDEIKVRAKNIIINIFSDKPKNIIIYDVNDFLNKFCVNIVFVQLNINGETVIFDSSGIKMQCEIFNDFSDNFSKITYCTINKNFSNAIALDEFIIDITTTDKVCQNFATYDFEVKKNDDSDKYLTHVYNKLTDNFNPPKEDTKCEYIVFLNVGITHIQDDFLRDYIELREFDSHGFENIDKIENNVLHSCPNLTNIDCEGFKNVDKIGEHFLCGCAKLTYFNCGGFIKLREVGHGFTASCMSLQAFNSRGFENVEKIGDHFLCCCENLTRVNYGGFINVKEIGCNFMIFCRSLLNFDPQGFKNVVKIDDRFLYGCGKLENKNHRKSALDYSIYFRGIDI